MDSIIKHMQQFHQSPTAAKFRERLRQKSLLDIWGVGRRETVHNNFLARLLCPEVQESSRAIVEQGKKVNQRNCSKYVCQNSEGRSSDPMGNRRIVLYVVKNYAEETDCTHEQLKQTFAPRWFEEFRNVDLNTRPKRYFIADDEFVKIAKKLDFVISSQQL